MPWTEVKELQESGNSSQVGGATVGGGGAGCGQLPLKRATSVPQGGPLDGWFKEGCGLKGVWLKGVGLQLLQIVVIN